MGRKTLADTRKPEILMNYYKTIIEEGYENASIPNIAKRMKVYPNLITHYFKSKEQLELSLVEYIRDEYLNAFANIIEENEPSVKNHKRLVRVLFSKKWNSLIDDSVFFALFYQTFRNLKIKKEFQKVFKEYHKVITEVLEKSNVENAQNSSMLIIMLVEGYYLFRSLKINFDHETFSKYLEKILEMALSSGDKKN